MFELLISVYIVLPGHCISLIYYFSVIFKETVFYGFMIENTRGKSHGCPVIQRKAKPKCLVFSASDKCSSQHSTANAEFNPSSAFSLSQPVKCDTEWQLLLYSKCILNAHFQVLKLLEELLA